MVISRLGDSANDGMLDNGYLSGEVLKLTYSVNDTVAEGNYPFILTVCETADASENYLATATVSAEVSVKEAVKGDLDNDGTVTIADVMLLIRAIVNDQTIENGDISGDVRQSQKLCKPCHSKAAKKHDRNCNYNRCCGGDIGIKAVYQKTSPPKLIYSKRTTRLP
jgi:hypothetical protein